jgi:hypothetical protein
MADFGGAEIGACLLRSVHMFRHGPDTGLDGTAGAEMIDLRGEVLKRLANDTLRFAVSCQCGSGIALLVLGIYLICASFPDYHQGS